MEEFQKLYQIAAELNLGNFAEKMAAVAKTIMTSEFTKVAVTGMRNCGKTTFINSITGSTVWEPSIVSEDEKPLRISFEPLPEDEKFNCLLVANQNWNDLKTIIYELQAEQLLEQKHLAEEMYPLDMVFFIVSATSPFGSDELDFLKALNPLKCQLIVNKINLLKENEQKKIISYIEKINDSLSLPPIVIANEDENFGKVIRGLVPAYMELQQIRRNKCADIFNYVLATLEKNVNEKIKAQKNAAQSSENETLNSALQNHCYTLRTDLEEYRKNAVALIADNLNVQRKKILNEIISASESVSNVETLQTVAEKKYLALANAAVDSLQKSFMNDLQKINSSAMLLKIPQWNNETCNILEKFAPKNLQENSPEKLNIPPQNTMGDSSSIFIKTGIAAGSFAAAPIIVSSLIPTFAPLPPLFSIGGVIASVGFGVFSHMKEKTKKNKQFINALDEALRQSVENIKKWILDISAISYGKIIEQISIGENSAPKKNESAVNKLNDILRSINEIKTNSKIQPEV